MNLNGQERKVLLLLVFCIIVGTGVWFWRQVHVAKESAGEIIIGGQEEQASETEAKQEIFVHITGAVQNPGVYKVQQGTRLFQVVELAGGATAEADLEAVNLAQVVEDGRQMRIPAKGETQSLLSQYTGGHPKDVYPNSGEGVYNKGLVNINKASADELETLPGVGEAIAKKIIQYRNEHGPFVAIEDIKNVSGIGDKKFEQMKDLLTVQ